MHGGMRFFLGVVLENVLEHMLYGAFADMQYAGMMLVTGGCAGVGLGTPVELLRRWEVLGEGVSWYCQMSMAWYCNGAGEGHCHDTVNVMVLSMAWYCDGTREGRCGTVNVILL